MPASPSTSEMGRRHVERAAEVLGCVPSAGSGNRWQDPADGRSPHDGPYPVALEGKSTRGKSITVTLEMLAKLREQSLGENPVLPLCWYGTDDLTEILEDWAAVPLDFLAEILASARAWAELEAHLGSVTREEVTALVLKADLAEGLRRSLAGAQEALIQADKRLAARDTELDALREQAQAQSQVLAAEARQVVPHLPWSVVRLLPKGTGIGSAGDAAATVVDYDAAGLMTTWRAATVRIDRSMSNHPKVFVNDVQARNADVYDRDGRLLARVCRTDPSIEVG